MKNFIRLAVEAFITLIQIIALGVPTVLQYLSDKKMGVMRYLVFKNRLYQEWESGYHIFTLARGLLVVGLLLCCLTLLLRSRKNLPVPVGVSWIFCTALLSISGLLVGELFSPDNLLAYYFWVLAILLVVFLQFVRLPLRKVLKIQH